MTQSQRGPVGAFPPSATQEWRHDGRDDEVRVQRSATAYLAHHGGQSFSYSWHLRYTRWSRTHQGRQAAIEAMRTQGFGLYVDTDGTRIRLNENGGSR